MRPRRLERNFHFFRESPRLERLVKSGCLAFILRKIWELRATPAWSFAGMRSWRKSYAPSENTGWNRAISITSSVAIFASTKYKRQFSLLSFRIWKIGQTRGARLRIFMAQNWNALG